MFPHNKHPRYRFGVNSRHSDLLSSALDEHDEDTGIPQVHFIWLKDVYSEHTMQQLSSYHDGII